MDKEAMQAIQWMYRAVNSQCQAIICSRRQRQAGKSSKRPVFQEGNAKQETGIESRKRAMNARPSLGRQGSKKAIPVNNQMQLPARRKQKPINRLAGQQGDNAFQVTEETVGKAANQIKLLTL